MNGYELCKHIKEELEISHIPVILLTARNDDESQLFGYKNGADAYLTKPFEVNMLHGVIRSQLKNRERIRARYTETGSLPEPKESTFSSADEDFLHKLNKLISNNLDNAQMGIPFLYQELGVSRASLYNKLKALTGMGANDYITKLRIERAIFCSPTANLALMKSPNRQDSPHQDISVRYSNNIQDIHPHNTKKSTHKYPIFSVGTAVIECNYSR